MRTSSLNLTSGTQTINAADVLAGRTVPWEQGAPRPAARRGDDLRRLHADRAARGRREPNISRNIPRRRGY
jgi:hypothetical protein